jgi:hypothetical protein
VEERLGLSAKLDLFGVGDVEAGAVEAHIGAQVPRGSGGLVGGVAADDEDSG